MNHLTTARADRSARPLPAPVPPSLEISSTYLAPADPFPSALAEPDLVELHVPHSRITRQIESEYIDPAGPHPVTLDRAQELAAELDTAKTSGPPRHGRNRPEDGQHPTGALRVLRRSNEP